MRWPDYYSYDYIWDEPKKNPIIKHKTQSLNTRIFMKKPKIRRGCWI